MREMVLSGTILTAFLGGVVALLAPCCVSVMLPAYFSATFARRSRILAMTLVFAIGVGTVILPIGLGASAISRLLAGQHFAVFAVMGVLLAAGVVGLAVRHHSRMPLEPDPPDEDGTGPGTAGRGVDDQQSRPAGPPAEMILSREKDLQS